MSDVLAWMEGTALATWARESPSIWAYPTILALHSFGLGIVVGACAIIDVRILGMAKRIAPPALRSLYPIIWWAFALNAATGLILFMADATRKAGQPIFYVKLGFIAAAVIAAAMMRSRLTDDAAPASSRALAIASLLCWTGAITAGRFMAYL